MDLFGFAKDIGRRLFNSDEDAADKIKEHIEENNPGVENLEVTTKTASLICRVNAAASKHDKNAF